MEIRFDLRNSRGQILIEAMIVTAFMVVILLFLDQLILLKKNEFKKYSFVKNAERNVNQNRSQNMLEVSNDK